jgi:uncharacterized protein (DUF983 family)
VGRGHRHDGLGRSNQGPQRSEGQFFRRFLKLTPYMDPGGIRYHDP